MNTTQYLLLLLDAFLLELRNLEPQELEFAPKLAYIFHNVPAVLLTTPTPEACEFALQTLRARADALGVQAWMQNLESTARWKLEGV